MPEQNRQSLYFLTHSSAGADNWPFYECMRSDETDVKVFGNSVSLKYARRIWLYGIGWPRLFLSGLQLAGRCIKELKPETVVTAHDHMLLLAFKLRRFFSPKARRTPHHIALHGFIYTPRSSGLLNALRKLYFTTLFRKISLIICHSNHEIEKIQTLVDPNTARVSAVHYGIGEGEVIKKWWQEYAAQPTERERSGPIKIVSAGRSSRDYATLAKAMAALGEEYVCDIVCDNYTAAPASLETSNVVIHRNLYGPDYAKKIIDADIMVVPTTADDISAGQMVLLHGLAAARPVIISETPTSVEYLENTEMQRLVKPEDAGALEREIRDMAKRLPIQPDTRRGIRQLFEEKFSDYAHGRKAFSLYKDRYNF